METTYNLLSTGYAKSQGQALSTIASSQRDLSCFTFVLYHPFALQCNSSMKRENTKLSKARFHGISLFPIFVFEYGSLAICSICSSFIAVQL
jgi:hypothetical protein